MAITPLDIGVDCAVGTSLQWKLAYRGVPLGAGAMAILQLVNKGG
jgi:hypothetical protein